MRIHGSTRKKEDLLLKKINSKKEVHTVKLNDLFNLSLNKVTDSEIDILQNESLRIEGPFEKMRKFYCKNTELISKRDFTDFPMKLEYNEFLKIYHQKKKQSLLQGGV